MASVRRNWAVSTQRHPVQATLHQVLFSRMVMTISQKRNVVFISRHLAGQESTQRRATMMAIHRDVPPNTTCFQQPISHFPNQDLLFPMPELKLDFQITVTFHPEARRSKRRLKIQLHRSEQGWTFDSINH